MALIKCPECGHDVSDTAETCPNCGYRLKEKTDYSFDYSTYNRINKRLKEKFIGGIIGSIFLFIYGIVILFQLGDPDTPSALPIIMSISIIALAVGMFIFTCRKLNPDINSAEDIYNTRVKTERIGILIGGIIALVGGVALIILISTFWGEYGTSTGLILAYLYVIFCLIFGIGAILYYLYKKKHDF